MASTASSQDALQEHDQNCKMAPPSSDLRVSLDNFSNALVLLPPPSIQARVNALRCANDKSFPRWPAHVTLIFPFVNSESLPSVIQSLRTALEHARLNPFKICFDHVGRFRQREYETVYLGPSQDKGGTQKEGVQQLWEVLAQALHYEGRAFVPHLTLGQTSHRSEDIQLLESKGSLLLQDGPLVWTVDCFKVLQKDEMDGGTMKIVDELIFPTSHAVGRWGLATETSLAYHYSTLLHSWQVEKGFLSSVSAIDELSILSFNILHTPENNTITRFDRIRSVLLDAACDIICLQEVTVEFLALLLRDETIRLMWPWSTRGPDLPMESERNVVVLSADHLPFAWKRVVLGAKHKAASILSLNVTHRERPNSTSTPVTINLAAIHLTAGLTPQLLGTKTREFDTLLRYLQENHPTNMWIIAGDTNFPTDFEPSVTFDARVSDVWKLHHSSSCSNVHDATYDPGRNILASQTARADRSAQRYDRIYVKGSGFLRINSVDIFDSGASSENTASDHWPIVARFRLVVSESPDVQHVLSQEPVTASVTHVANSPTSSAAEDPSPDADLLQLLQESNAIPSLEQDQQRGEAIQSLCRFIGASLDCEVKKDRAGRDIPENSGLVRTGSSVKLILVPVGSTAMGVHFPDGDIDCAVIGNVSSATFWEVMKEKLAIYTGARAQEHESRPTILLHCFVKDAAVQMMVLSVEGVKVDLQYCPAAILTESWSSPDFSIERHDVTLSVPAMRVLNAHRDRLRLQRTIPSYAAFQLACRFIKLFCSHRGVYAARFGYLGGIHIAILLCRVAESSPAITTACELVKSFFENYSSFDWASRIASVANVVTTYRRSAREPIVILSPLKPVVNVAVNASVPTARIITEEFRNAYDALQRNCTWREVCCEPESAVAEFLGKYQQFIRLDLSYWGGNCMEARALTGYIEARIVHLLVDLHAADQNTRLRLWPERFSDSRPSGSKSATVNGFYLIGVDREDEPKRQKSLISVLHGFETSIQNNATYYDASSAFFAVSECGRSVIPATVFPDRIVWADDGIDDPDDSESEDNGIVGATEDLDLHDRFAFQTKSSCKKQQNASRKGTPYIPAPKLRTSADIFNRLMWDPQYEKNDYLIGYEDRFLGLQERSLMSWRRDIDDDDYIPLHRVVYFKCKSSDDIVWDRRTKVDRVFGSGVGLTSES